MEKEGNTTAMKSATSFVGSSPISGRIKAFEASPRKVLSPINSNVERNSFEDSSCKDQMCSGLFEAKTPKTPFILPSENFEFQTIRTPLHKFNALSNNLKVCQLCQHICKSSSLSLQALLYVILI